MIRIALFFCLFLSILHAEDPTILYLTWRDDPATTMTVVWHTVGLGPESTVRYKRTEDSYWQSQEGTFSKLYGTPVAIHQVDLTDLEPDTAYIFQVNNGELHQFKTLPNEIDRPLKIAIGGDAYFTKELYEKMNAQVLSHDPDFAIVAGDLAYSEGLSCALRPRSWKLQRWEDFFTIWTKQMVTKEGRMIPLMTVLGNHDVKEGFDNPHKEQVFFYAFFPLPKKGIPYRLFTVANTLSFYLLDSGHSYPIAGAQAEWLEKTLQSNRDVLYHIPVYHIAAYPSEVSPNHRGSKDIRKFWVPLFEEYGVKVSMEHDNHTFKRTFPIRQNMVAPGGITYLGDGAWGVPPLKPHRHWYLAKALQSSCFWLLTLDQHQVHLQAYDNEGVTLDEIDVTPLPQIVNIHSAM